MTPSQHTVQQYRQFQQAYDYFNTELWSGTLPQVLVTLQRKPRMMGHFAPERYQHRRRGELIHEIALNPDCFVGQTDEQVLDTLVHEMAHVWQQTFGSPGRRGYHNRQWGKEMKRIGLYPSSTGAPGGRETGEHMSDYIILGGPFQVACRRLLDGGFRLQWQSHYPKPFADGVLIEDEHELAKRKGRIRFTCPDCRLRAWAKPDASLLCGRCWHHRPEQPITLRPEHHGTLAPIA
jgi:hypothetical protein